MITQRPRPSRQQRPQEPWLDEEEEGEPQRVPWWKTRRGLYFLVGLLLIVGFIFSRGHDTASPQDRDKATAVAIVVPHDTIVPDVKAAPAAQPAADKAPQPPAVLDPRNLRPPGPPGSAGPVQHPAMVSFPAPNWNTSSTASGTPAESAKTSVKFSAATIPGTKASPAQDMTYWLTPGLMLLVLETAISSDRPGKILAHLPGDVYSEYGVLLMESGSKVIGDYKSMTRGNQRLDVAGAIGWTHNGVWVNLAGSLATDSLGVTGLSGELNERYPERFAGAVLLDLSGAALQIAQAEVAKGGNTYLNFNSTDSLATQILRQQADIPSILTKKHGDWMALLIPAPISFQDSYEIQRVGP